MGTAPLYNPKVTNADLARDKFGANFCTNPVEKVIWAADNIRTVAGPANLENWDGPDLAQVASSQTSGLLMANSKDLNYLWRLPSDIDTSMKLELAVLMSNSEAASGSKYVTTVTKVKAMIVGTTAVAIPATAVTSEMSVMYAVGANVLQEPSTWAILSGATFAAMGLTPGKDCLAMMFTAGLTVAADFTFWKIMARFYVKQVSGGV
jgi:hypothetical protein